MSVAPVHAVGEALENSQVLARQMSVDVTHPRHGSVRQAGIAVKLSDTPGSIRGAAPVVGEHTEEVLQALGYDETEWAQLRQAGTVA